MLSGGGADGGAGCCADAPAPVLLMVSGGSDSTALLELCCTLRDGTSRSGAEAAGDELVDMLARALPDGGRGELAVLHVNHHLRGDDADADEHFVTSRCADLDVSCTVRHADPAVLRASADGLEAAARAERYRLAGEVLDTLCADCGVPPERGVIATAHTLDDRVETFLMRAMVGCGPGGLASIPRVRGRVRRPLLSATREELRAWLREGHPGVPDAGLWCEDVTNTDGSNFRGRVRTELVGVMRELRPGFERSLERTMDLIADEDAAIAEEAESLAYRYLTLAGGEARLPADVVCSLVEGGRRYVARRLVRAMALAISPDSRLESAQIERVVDGVAGGVRESGGGAPGQFATELAGGIRVRLEDGDLVMRVVV